MSWISALAALDSLVFFGVGVFVARAGLVPPLAGAGLALAGVLPATAGLAMGLREFLARIRTEAGAGG